ncbi:MAG TPA: hypothetical protein H9784_03580, partial [Candidatus Desulfovibrio intestinavium]|nr:hypothetical protein [Candidatus Desulfovibrio intestinavium]
SMDPVKIVAIGDNVCDKYLSRGKMYPGGQCVNTWPTPWRAKASRASPVPRRHEKKQAGHHRPARLFFPAERPRRGRLPCGE